MKIQNDPSVVKHSTLQKATSDAKTAKAQENTSVSGDNVQLSARALECNRIKEILEQVPDVRQEKVEQLNRQVADGSYKPDTEKTAEKLIKESLIDLLA